MGSNSINLALRFLLELGALISIGMWAWKQGDGWHKYLFVIGLPLLLAIIWGIFAVPNDPSRSGAAPVITPGIIRLFIELGIFAFASWALYDSGFDKFAYGLALAVLIHYIASYDRMIWLLSQS